MPEFRPSGTQDVQFDRQITYTPPQHNKWIYENLATGVQCLSSGPLENARLLSNNAGPASSTYKLVLVNSALPNTHFAIDAGQSCDVEDGKVINWKPIPSLYKLAAPADVQPVQLYPYIILDSCLRDLIHQTRQFSILDSCPKWYIIKVMRYSEYQTQYNNDISWSCNFLTALFSRLRLYKFEIIASNINK